jgi:hypothetical protein
LADTFLRRLDVAKRDHDCLLCGFQLSVVGFRLTTSESRIKTEKPPTLGGRWLFFDLVFCLRTRLRVGDGNNADRGNLNRGYERKHSGAARELARYVIVVMANCAHSCMSYSESRRRSNQEFESLRTKFPISVAAAVPAMSR